MSFTNNHNSSIFRKRHKGRSVRQRTAWCLVLGITVSMIRVFIPIVIVISGFELADNAWLALIFFVAINNSHSTNPDLLKIKGDLAPVCIFILVSLIFVSKEGLQPARFRVGKELAG